MFIFILWIGLSFVVAISGDDRKIGFGWTFVISLLFSPIIGFIAALTSKPNVKVELKRQQPTRYNMGKCIFCNKNAGWFSSAHKECETKHKKGKEDFVDMLSACIVSGGDFTALDKQLGPILKDSFIMDIEYCFTSLIVAAYDRAVNQFLEDAGLSEEEEGRLLAFQNHYDFSEKVLDENGSYQKVVKAAILRDIANGVLPKRMKITDSLPVILQKSETVIWAFTNVQYFERKTKTVYHGKTNGVSVRVAKGVYYRTSAFKGNPVQVDELKYVDSGLLIFTNKNVYFSSVMKNFKTPYSGILSINPYEDGVDFQRHDMKPQVFKGIDGWFAYNLISNMATFEVSPPALQS